MPSRFAAIVLMTVLAMSHVVAAADQPRPQRLGLCAACHGENGRAIDKTVPNLAGQNLEYLRVALKQYQSGGRDIAAMRAAIGMLNADEQNQLLQWYAAQDASGR